MNRTVGIYLSENSYHAYRETDIDNEVEERKLKSCLKNFSQVISGQVAGSRRDSGRDDDSGGGRNIRKKSRSRRSVGTQTTSRVGCKLM